MATLYEPFQNRLPGAPPIPQGFRPPAAPAQRMSMMSGNGNTGRMQMPQQKVPQQQVAGKAYYPPEGGYEKPEQEVARIGVGMQGATMQLLKGMQGMSGQDQQAYLSSMQQNLTQRLQRYQVLMARGFGEEMDDAAKRDYQSIMKSLTDVNKMMNNPEYMASMYEQYGSRPAQAEGERFKMKQTSLGNWYS